jgi:radical SAM superfamily enzyme YgiQ (UPF0313 family)
MTPTVQPILLIGFVGQTNLGLGYLAAVLERQGYRVEIGDFESDPAEILNLAQSKKPLLIGFSLIFQFYIDRFKSLAALLRESGVACHFTIGGHFPSLSYRQTLELIPQLDSVVRFEGEETLLELVDRLSVNADWRDIKGIAHRKGSQIEVNELRPLVHDLDSLPYPRRDRLPETVLGQPIMTLLASRGCARTCSFCSIHMFYRAAPGKVVRTRKPQEVVREMQFLHETCGATIFLFQDDDFPLFGRVWTEWARSFIGELRRSGLADKVIWKISCRADAVDEVLFAEMKAVGLYFVYMGLESGTDEGLTTLNKKITAAQNLRAVQILKKLGIFFHFGFMLFEPSSTFQSIDENLTFLHAILDDGSVALTFCRMIPYDGTPIKDELIRQGRLTGDISQPGYDFLDPRLDRFYDALTRTVDLRGWVHGYDSLSPQINIAWGEIGVLERLFPPLDDMEEYKSELRQLTKESNGVLFDVIEDTARVFSKGEKNKWDDALLRAKSELFLARLLEKRNRFILRHQQELLRALGPRIDLAAASA